MQKKASKTETARVTINSHMLDGFSVEITVKTAAHTYMVQASWSAWDGWDIDVLDETGAEHDADALAHRLGYEDRSDLLSNLTDGMFSSGDRRFSLTVPAGA